MIGADYLNKFEFIYSFGGPDHRLNVVEVLAAAGLKALVQLLVEALKLVRLHASDGCVDAASDVALATGGAEVVDDFVALRLHVSARTANGFLPRLPRVVEEGAAGLAACGVRGQLALDVALERAAFVIGRGGFLAGLAVRIHVLQRQLFEAAIVFVFVVSGRLFGRDILLLLFRGLGSRLFLLDFQIRCSRGRCLLLLWFGGVGSRRGGCRLRNDSGIFSAAILDLLDGSIDSRGGLGDILFQTAYLRLRLFSFGGNSGLFLLLGLDSLQQVLPGDVGWSGLLRLFGLRGRGRAKQTFDCVPIDFIR